MALPLQAWISASGQKRTSSWEAAPEALANVRFRSEATHEITIKLPRPLGSIEPSG
jgi:hypothetical protein